MARYNKRISDKFDKSVQQIFVFAKAATIDAKVDCIYPESVVVGILTTGANEATNALVDMGIDLRECLKKFKALLAKKQNKNDSQDAPSFNDLKISKDVVDICKKANDIREDSGIDLVHVSHLFLAIFELSNVISTAFKKQGLDVETFKDYLRNQDYEPLDDLDAPSLIMGDQDHEEFDSSEKTKRSRKKNASLEKFCSNVTDLARKNVLDPIIAREKEIEEAITILCRRGKNNPIFLGEPGVGKTAIVEGISQRIVSKTVPKQLLDNEIYSLSLSSLVAGTKYRGEFEERIQMLIEDLQKSDNCILFIDEIHTLVGAGSAAAGALDASNILKPFLARNSLRCMGATTLEDYKKYFKKDGALVRRFQEIIVEEPTKDQMVQILAGVKTKLEKYHDCIISEDAVNAVIDMAARYLSNRKFPDKAIDCLDTACAHYVWQTTEDRGRIINKEDVARTISTQCQIPLEVILWDDHERIHKIENILHEKVVGQEQAIERICSSLKNAYSGVRNPNRPIGSFVFGGQTGTGKTYMARELALSVFGKESALIRLDMTEFAEPHSISKLLGSPPGYVGFSEGDVFADKIKRKPSCVVLLDEIEKAHPDVMKLFLQVMSDGTMTDSVGHKINFKNVILVMTGNFGMNEDVKPSLGFATQKIYEDNRVEQKRLITYCQERYGQEFVNRVDEFLVFKPLSTTSLKKIASMRLDELSERLKQRKCKVSITDAGIDLLLRKYKEAYGRNATALNRLIVKEVEPCVSDALMTIKDGSYTVIIDALNGKFKYRKRKLKQVKVKK